MSAGGFDRKVFRQVESRSCRSLAWEFTKNGRSLWNGCSVGRVGARKTGRFIFTAEVVWMGSSRYCAGAERGGREEDEKGGLSGYGAGCFRFDLGDASARPPHKLYGVQAGNLAEG